MYGLRGISEALSVVISLQLILLPLYLPLTRALDKDKEHRKGAINDPPFGVEKDTNEIKTCLSKDLDEHEKKTCRFFALMIDAGSTGTRLHVFEFSHDTQNSASPFKLEEEYFYEEKPGLSSFAGSPEMAVLSVKALLNYAQKVVPQNLWKDTPIQLKATAGMRLINSLEADQILAAVTRLVDQTPFLTNEQSVTIMSGTDEGFFAWFTLNLLTDRIHAVMQSPRDLIGKMGPNLTGVALDLGGGSTQITFRPLHIENITPSYLKDVTIFGQPTKIYTHSYLGNGLVAGRLGTLRLSSQISGQSLNADTLFSSCFPQLYQSEWNYTQKFLLRGLDDYSFDACYNQAREYVLSSGLDAPSELVDRDVYAFSYFYDRAKQAQLVDSEKGGNVSVGDFASAARKACERTTFGKEHWQPWQCFDLAYIYSLLHDGYSLSDNKQITLTKKLRGMETSWALGASYHLLNSYHDRSGSDSSFCYYLCSRLFYGLTNLMNFFQLVA